MMLVQWTEEQKGKNVRLTLSTVLKELGLSCSPNAFKLQLKLTPKPQLCEQIRARPVHGLQASQLNASRCATGACAAGLDRLCI